MKHIIVIGSGFGGLAIAVRLQARGFQVTLLEKNARVGGHAYQLQKRGYTFDMGPSLITAPEIIRAIFDVAGKRLEDYLELVKLDPFYRLYFHDGTRLDYSDDGARMKAQMAAFNPHDAANYDRFMQDSRGIYEAVILEGLGATPFMDLSTLIKFVPRALKLKALYPAHYFVSRYFQDPRHRFTFSFHPLFIGGNPFRVGEFVVSEHIQPGTDPCPQQGTVVLELARFRPGGLRCLGPDALAVNVHGEHVVSEPGQHFV
ncbi:FAD-dependent oxidoreductase, partial [candidate division KSB1 bacterium]|nr:FAD-dependent oxidoreductase [candidate division KSB1 bacterium]